MSVYLLTIKKCAPRRVRLPPMGEFATVEHTLAFSCAHAGSYRADDQRRVAQGVDRAKARMGEHFTGLVFLGAAKAGTMVLRWDAAPFWFDCDEFPAGTVKVGILVPSRGRNAFNVSNNVDAVRIVAVEGEKPEGTVAPAFNSPAHEWTPFVTRYCRPGASIEPGRVVLSRQPMMRPEGQEEQV